MCLCCVFLLGCLDDWLKGVQYGVCVLYVCHVFCQLLSLCTYSLGGFIFILIFAQSYLDLLLTSGVFTWRYCNSFSACLQCCEVPQCFSWYNPFPVSWGVRCCTPSIFGRRTTKKWYIHFGHYCVKHVHLKFSRALHLLLERSESGFNWFLNKFHQWLLFKMKIFIWKI